MGLIIICATILFSLIIVATTIVLINIEDTKRTRLRKENDRLMYELSKGHFKKEWED